MRRLLLLAVTFAATTGAMAAPDTTLVVPSSPAFAVEPSVLDSAEVGFRQMTEAPDVLALPDPSALGRMGDAVTLPSLAETDLPGASDVRPVVFEPATQVDADGELAPADSLVLPARMPFYTRMFWGRHGLIRTLGLAPSSRRGELELRRSMLTWHQRMGLVTWAAFTGQFVMGEIMAADPQKRGDLSDLHRATGYTTFALYMGTAGLSLGAPPGRRYSNRFSSTKLHKYLAIIHFSGMAATPLLGAWVAEGSGTSYDTRLNTHQWVTRVTYAAYSAALATMYLLR